MAIQVQGSGGVVAQVETNTQAIRVVARPNDVGALGAYSLGAVSGVMAAGIAANSPIFSFRYGGSNLVLLKRVLISAANAGTAFAAGVGERVAVIELAIFPFEPQTCRLRIGGICCLIAGLHPGPDSAARFEFRQGRERFFARLIYDDVEGARELHQAVAHLHADQRNHAPGSGVVATERA